MVMAARQLARGCPNLDLPTLYRGALEAIGLGPAPRKASGDDGLTAQALAAGGLAALLGLPILLLASVTTEAPLAVPAIIALAYLAAAQALSFGRARLADGWSAAAAGGFVLWTAFYGVLGDAPQSLSGMAAALAVPLFAVAPALAQRFLASRNGCEPGAADEDGGDRDGLAASRAEPRSDPARLRAEAANVEQPSIPPAASCEIAVGIGFALTHAGAQAKAAGVALFHDQDYGLSVACDRALCRRILVTLVRDAVAASRAGEEVFLSAKGVRGAVLIRIEYRARSGDRLAEGPGAADVALDAAREWVEGAGGTLLRTVDAKGDVTLSIRLAKGEGNCVER